MVSPIEMHEELPFMLKKKFSKKCARSDSYEMHLASSGGKWT